MAPRPSWNSSSSDRGPHQVLRQNGPLNGGSRMNRSTRNVPPSYSNPVAYRGIRILHPVLSNALERSPLPRAQANRPRRSLNAPQSGIIQKGRCQRQWFRNEYRGRRIGAEAINWRNEGNRRRANSYNAVNAYSLFLECFGREVGMIMFLLVSAVVAYLFLQVLWKLFFHFLNSSF